MVNGYRLTVIGSFSDKLRKRPLGPSDRLSVKG